MTIKGDHTVDASIEELWILLQDPEILTRIAPGVSTIEPLGQDHFKATSSISIGPVKGNFIGELYIKDKREGERMTLELKQKSRIGHAKAKIVMDLESMNPDRTKVIYNGKAKVSGTLASMGQRILGGVVKTMTKQVFSELENVIREDKGIDVELEVIPAEKKGLFYSFRVFIKNILTKIQKLWK